MCVPDKQGCPYRVVLWAARRYVARLFFFVSKRLIVEIHHLSLFPSRCHLRQLGVAPASARMTALLSALVPS